MIQADPDNDPDPGCRGFEHAKAGKGRQEGGGWLLKLHLSGNTQHAELPDNKSEINKLNMTDQCSPHRSHIETQILSIDHFVLKY